MTTDDRRAAETAVTVAADLIDAIAYLADHDARIDFYHFGGNIRLRVDAARPARTVSVAEKLQPAAQLRLAVERLKKMAGPV